MASTQSEIEVVYKVKGADQVANESKKINNALEVQTGFMRGVGQAALAGFQMAGTALMDFGKQSIQLASDVEEMQAKFDIVFKTVGEEVTAELDKFGDAAGRSKFELMGMAATLGDTLKPMGFTEEAAGNMSVELTKLAADLGSFNNMEMDEALQRLQGTLIGSHENALAFGVIINENTLKAELAANGWDTLTGAQLEQAKVQARVNLLMAGTTDAQGDAIRTADSYANKQRALAAVTEELQVTLGTMLLPALTDATTAMAGYVKGAADGAAAMADMKAAAADMAQQNFQTAEATGDWQQQGEKLTTTLEENNDILFKLFGRKFVVEEMQQIAVASGNWKGTNEELAASLTEVFGQEVQVSDQMVTMDGLTIGYTDNMRILSEEYAIQTSAAEAMSEEYLTQHDIIGAVSADTAMLNSHLMSQYEATNNIIHGMDAAGNMAQFYADKAIIAAEASAGFAIDATNSAIGMEAANVQAEKMINMIFDLEPMRKELRDTGREAGSFGDAVDRLATRLGEMPKDVFIKIRVEREGDALPGEVDWGNSEGGATDKPPEDTGPSGPGGGGYAHGANFIVPPGYENDGYRMNVSSGERVVVVPKSQVNNNWTWNVSTSNFNAANEQRTMQAMFGGI